MLLTFASGGVACSAARVRGSRRAAHEGGGEEIGDCPRNPRERYAQVGINLEWDTPVVKDPPAGVYLLDADKFHLSDGINQEPLSDEAKKLVEEYGTKDNITDIHVFYVTQITSKAAAPYTLWGGYALADNKYDGSDQPYVNNIFLEQAGGDTWHGYAAAHELGHLLGNYGHPITTDSWRLMYDSILTTNGVLGSRRLIQTEETSYRGSPLAK